MVYVSRPDNYPAPVKINELTHEIIGAAIEVHRELGPGKPEAAYERALSVELSRRQIPHVTQRALPIVYKGVKLDCGYRLDLLVGNIVIVEVKAVEAVHPIHRAQVLTYLKLGGWKIALLLNFNVAVLKSGVERLVLGLGEDNCATVSERAEHGTPAASVETPRTFQPEEDCGDEEAEALARAVVNAAFEVHRALGPGLLPSAYQACLCHELHLHGIPFERKRSLPLVYKGTPLAETDELELVVGGKVVVNSLACSELGPVYAAAMLSQLRLGGWKLGLLVNFNAYRLADGLRRLVLSQGR